MTMFYLSTYLFYIIPASIGVFILWRYAHKQSQWSNWELNVLILPHLAWWSLFILVESDKNLGNLLEPAFFGIGAIVVTKVRIGLWHRYKVEDARIAMGAILVLSAIIIWLTIPGFPEVN